MINEKFDPSGNVFVEPFLASLAGGSDGGRLGSSGGGCCSLRSSGGGCCAKVSWVVWPLSLRDGLPLSGGYLLMGTMLRKLY